MRFIYTTHQTNNYLTRGEETFSHGCIRIAKPYELLATFAKFEQSFSYDYAQRILKGKNDTQWNLDIPVPIHIIYLTAWVNTDGLLHYRDDVYHYDQKQNRTIK